MWMRWHRRVGNCTCWDRLSDVKAWAATFMTSTEHAPGGDGVARGASGGRPTPQSGQRAGTARRHRAGDDRRPVLGHSRVCAQNRAARPSRAAVGGGDLGGCAEAARKERAIDQPAEFHRGRSLPELRAHDGDYARDPRRVPDRLHAVPARGQPRDAAGDVGVPDDGQRTGGAACRQREHV